jgi:hypothetical protein
MGSGCLRQLRADKVPVPEAEPRGTRAIFDCGSLKPRQQRRVVQISNDSSRTSVPLKHAGGSIGRGRLAS